MTQGIGRKVALRAAGKGLVSPLWTFRPRREARQEADAEALTISANLEVFAGAIALGKLWEFLKLSIIR